jgi:hypothetical protein
MKTCDSVAGAVKMARVWAMPNRNTFKCKPIGCFVQKYLKSCGTSIDPFAGDCGWATYTNDLNEKTGAMFHLSALNFLRELRSNGVVADCVLFDPPYSRHQIVETYKSYGMDVPYRGFGAWKKEKNIADELLVSGGVFLHFGWHTNGMGKKRGYEIEEILIVAHGGGHYDTLCMAERKL